MWLWATFLVVISWIRLPMYNYQANVNTNHFKNISVFYYKTVFILTFFTFFHNPNFPIISNHCINKTNTMTCAMKRETWTCYLPSHLVPAIILCSRCEPCTNFYSNSLKSRTLYDGRKTFPWMFYSFLAICKTFAELLMWYL